MNTDKATPRPWSACNNGKCSCRHIWGVDGQDNIVTARPTACVHGEWGDDKDMLYGEIPPEEVEANAALIVAAVNAWDDPSALRNRLEELERKATMEVLEIASKQEADHA